MVIVTQQTTVSSGDHFVGGPQWTENHPRERRCRLSRRHTRSRRRDKASGDHFVGEPLFGLFCDLPAENAAGGLSLEKTIAWFDFTKEKGAKGMVHLSWDALDVLEPKELIATFGE